jgi:hypothetical protein
MTSKFSESVVPSFVLIISKQIVYLSLQGAKVPYNPRTLQLSIRILLCFWKLLSVLVLPIQDVFNWLSSNSLRTF